jgi:hypothetical protein
MKELLLKLSLGTTLHNGKTCPFVDFDDVIQQYQDVDAAVEAIQPFIVEGYIDLIEVDDEEGGTYLILTDL